MRDFQFRGVETAHTFDDNATKKAKAPKNTNKKSKINNRLKKRLKKMEKDLRSLEKSLAQLNNGISERNLAKMATVFSPKEKRPENRVIHLVRRGE